MNRLLIIGLSTAAVVGAVHVNGSFAETGETPLPAQAEPKTAPAMQTARPGPADNQIADGVNARIARLRTDPRLTSNQEKNWSGLRTALHNDGVGQIKGLPADGNAHQDRRDRPDEIIVMRSEADQLTARAALLKKLAGASEPLYGSLDDRQRHKLVQFMRTEFNIERY
jgi:hypothetical protein